MLSYDELRYNLLRALEGLDHGADIVFFFLYVRSRKRISISLRDLKPGNQRSNALGRAMDALGKWIRLKMKG